MFCVTEQEAGMQSLVTGPQSSGEPPKQPRVTGNFQPRIQHLLRSQTFLVIQMMAEPGSFPLPPNLSPPIAFLQGFGVPLELPSSDPALQLLPVSPHHNQQGFALAPLLCCCISHLFMAPSRCLWCPPSPGLQVLYLGLSCSMFLSKYSAQHPAGMAWGLLTLMAPCTSL